MSSPHQPGWSDDELIALGDLRVNRQAMNDSSSSNSSGRPRRPAPRAAQTQQRQQPQRQQPQQPQRRPRPQGTTQSQRPSQSQPVAAPRNGANRPNGNRNPSTNREAQAARSVFDVDLRKLLPGAKADVAIDERLLRKVRYPLHGATVGVFNRKGGDGKTAVAAYLGLTLAAMRKGSVLAVDGDNVSGSLGYLLAPQAQATLTDLVEQTPAPKSMEDFAPFITRAARSLYVVAGDTDESPLDEVLVRSNLQSLARLYDVSIFDAGTAAPHTPGRCLLELSNIILLVTGPSIDSVRAAERSLNWLNKRQGRSESKPAVLVVMNGIPSNMRETQVEEIEELFANGGAAVSRIPWDSNLSDGTTSASLDQLAKPTQQAFQQLAVDTVELLARRRPRHNPRQRNA